MIGPFIKGFIGGTLRTWGIAILIFLVVLCPLAGLFAHKDNFEVERYGVLQSDNAGSALHDLEYLDRIVVKGYATRNNYHDWWMRTQRLREEGKLPPIDDEMEFIAQRFPPKDGSVQEG
jgi:hypothetical protein